MYFLGTDARRALLWGTALGACWCLSAAIGSSLHWNPTGGVLGGVAMLVSLVGLPGLLLGFAAAGPLAGHYWAAMTVFYGVGVAVNSIAYAFPILVVSKLLRWYRERRR